MKKKTGMSKKMRSALKAEGLDIHEYVFHDEIVYECVFYCGANDNEKSCTIDLRGKDIESEDDADRACWRELDECHEAYDVADSMLFALEAQRNGVRGVPPPHELLAECQEEEARLERFAKVADCIYQGIPVPPLPEEARWQQEERDEFYVIQNANNDCSYWKTLGGYHNGAISDACGDILKADRFDTLYEVKAFIKEHRREGGAGDGVPVRVETTTSIRISRLDDL